MKGLSLNAKMMLAPLVLIAVIVAVGAIGYTALTGTAAKFNLVADESIPNIRYSDEMFLSYRQIRISIRTLGLTGIDKDQEKKAIADTMAAIGEYEKASTEYAKIPMTADEKALFDKVDASWKSFKETGVKILGLHAAGGPENMAKIQDIFFHECPEKAEVYTAAITALVTFHRELAKKWSEEAHKTSEDAKRHIQWAILAGLLLGAGLAYFTVRSVSGLIGAISRVAESLGGDADKVAEISSGVSDASEKLSASSTEQAAAIQETTAALEETTQMVQKNADNATRSAEASKTSQANAEKGKQAMTEVIASIENISASNREIMDQIEESNREMTNIVNLINEIGEKTKVINDIVFQTKLLSFNASVEAARAGEHGKGFAVVAEEVGNLAAMSGRSSKEITALLDTSTQRVKEMAAKTKEKVEKLMTAGKQKIEAGITTARSCDQVLNEIVSTVGSVSSMVTEIATASQEQSRGISEINKAITELDSAAQQNSSTSQSAANYAVALSGQVNSLHESIQNLNGLVGRGNKESTPPGKAPLKLVPGENGRAAA